jgi:hypothetical protein
MRERQEAAEEEDVESTHSNHSDRSLDYATMPMGASFLHTIPEGSSDVGTSLFNPAVIDPVSASISSPWTNMMKPFRPGSVTSSTRAVEAGDAGAILGLDGSGNAVVLAPSEFNSTGGSLVATEATLNNNNNIYQRRASHSFVANRRKLGIVCLLTIVLVLVVVFALVMIVHNLDSGTSNEKEQGTQFTNNTGTDDSAVDSTITSTEGTTGNHTDTDVDTLSSDSNFTYTTVGDNQSLVESYNSPIQIPTLAPTAEGSVMMDDDFEGAYDHQSLLVRLDDAIFQLYTSDDARLNVLTDVSNEVFGHADSHRYKAREWLLNNDTLLQNELLATNEETESESLSLERIAQRYIMAVFYFATNTQHATDDNNPRDVSQYTAPPIFTLHPNVHECYWIANACGQSEWTPEATATATNYPVMADSIVYLNVSFAGLHGTLPFELGYLTALRQFSIPGNAIQGTVPEIMFTQLEYLYLVDLSENQLQGTIPTSLWILPTLRLAYLAGNQFTGTVPQTLPLEPSGELEEIWLGDNFLSGGIPSWWTTLPKLNTLSAGRNAWTGSLPPQWEQAQSLGFLDLSVNQITGSIPSSLLYSIPSLQHLYLDYNQLAGTLPTTTVSVGEPNFTVTLSRSAFKMEALWLQHNLLSGSIPPGFAWEYNRLRQLELHRNMLTGVWECVQPGFGDVVWPMLQELSVDCLEPSGVGVDMSLCLVENITCY